MSLTGLTDAGILQQGMESNLLTDCYVITNNKKIEVAFSLYNLVTRWNRYRMKEDEF